MKQLQHEKIREPGKGIPSVKARLDKFKGILECDESGRPIFSLKIETEAKLTKLAAEEGEQAAYARNLLKANEITLNRGNLGLATMGGMIGVAAGLLLVQITEVLAVITHASVSDLAVGFITVWGVSKAFDLRRGKREKFVGALEKVAPRLDSSDAP
jgi:hypothetical protein